MTKSLNSKSIFIWLGILLIVGIIVWQAVSASGVPDPTNKNLSIASVVLSSGILVFREGLEAILVLSAVLASITRKGYKKCGESIAAGVGLGLTATVITWFIVVAALSNINMPELDLQAATGLLAVAVLLVVMNWFFHRVYWTGWINYHNKRKRILMETPDDSNYRKFVGFALLGFTAVYREGFEIVLFLQQLRLEAGSTIVLSGAVIGLILTAIVAVLTFIAHQNLPYKKMLVLTGALLSVVLLVMVGESVQEMQQANWIASTPVGFSLPAWMGMWFAVFPNLQGLLSQAGAVLLVIGSYVSARITLVSSSS